MSYAGEALRGIKHKLKVEVPEPRTIEQIKEDIAAYQSGDAIEINAPAPPMTLKHDLPVVVMEKTLNGGWLVSEECDREDGAYSKRLGAFTNTDDMLAALTATLKA